MEYIGTNLGMFGVVGGATIVQVFDILLFCKQDFVAIYALTHCNKTFMHLGLPFWSQIFSETPVDTHSYFKRLVVYAVEHNLPPLFYVLTKTKNLKMVWSQPGYDHGSILRDVITYDCMLYYACKYARRDLIQHLIEVKNAWVREPDETDCSWIWSGGVIGACEGDHFDIVQKMFEYGANEDVGLNYACQWGRHDIVQFMLKKGATDYSTALCSACTGGQMDLVQLMIKKGVTSYAYEHGLRCACLSGHLQIAQFMVDKGASNYEPSLLAACSGGNADLAQLMLALGAKNWSKALSVACVGGNLQTIQMLLDKIEEEREKGETTNVIQDIIFLQYETALFSACQSGHLDAFQLVLESLNIHMARNNHMYKINWNEALKEACSGGNYQLVRLIIAIQNVPLDWKVGLHAACLSGHLKIARLMLEKISCDSVREYNSDNVLPCWFITKINSTYPEIWNLLFRYGYKMEERYL